LTFLISSKVRLRKSALASGVSMEMNHCSWRGDEWGCDSASSADRMLQLFAVHQHAALPEQFDDGLISVEDPLAIVFGASRFA